MFTDAVVFTLIKALVISRLEGLACNIILHAVHSIYPSAGGRGGGGGGRLRRYVCEASRARF